MRALLLCLSAIALAGTSQAAEPALLALMPVKVHSAQESSDYLSDGLAEMLSARLERSGQMRVMRVRGAAPEDLGAAVSSARDAGADYVLYGTFTQFGEGASLDVRCAPVAEGRPAEAAPRQVFVQSGSLGEIIPKLDAMADRIGRYVEEGPRAPAPAAAATAGAAAGSVQAASGADLEQLLERIDALERAVYANGAGPESQAGEAASAPERPAEEPIEITGAGTVGASSAPVR